MQIHLFSNKLSKNPTFHSLFNMIIISKITLNNVSSDYNVVKSKGISQSSPYLIFQHILILLTLPSFLKHSIALASRTTGTPAFPLASSHCQPILCHLTINCCNSSRFHSCLSPLLPLFSPALANFIYTQTINYSLSTDDSSQASPPSSRAVYPIACQHPSLDSKATQDQNGKTKLMSIPCCPPSPCWSSFSVPHYSEG